MLNANVCSKTQNVRVFLLMFMDKIISNGLLRGLCLFFIFKKNGKTTTNSHHDSLQNTIKLKDTPSKPQHSSTKSSFLNQIPSHSHLNANKSIIRLSNTNVFHQTPLHKHQHHPATTISNKHHQQTHIYHKIPKFWKSWKHSHFQN